jgi:hypothetical protein
MGWAEETGQIKSAIGPFLERRMRERKAYVVREQFPTRGDKAIRAQSIRGRMALEGLYVPTGADWYPDFRSELMSFPAGKHDDQVDALGLIGQLLDRMLKGAAPVKIEPVRGTNEMTMAEAFKLATPRAGRAEGFEFEAASGQTQRSALVCEQPARRFVQFTRESKDGIRQDAGAGIGFDQISSIIQASGWQCARPAHAQQRGRPPRCAQRAAVQSRGRVVDGRFADWRNDAGQRAEQCQEWPDRSLRCRSPPERCG